MPSEQNRAGASLRYERMLPLILLNGWEAPFICNKCELVLYLIQDNIFRSSETDAV